MHKIYYKGKEYLASIPDIIDVQINNTSIVDSENKIALIPTVIGTDGSSDGTAGLVPQPTTTDRNKFLKSDGTWAVPSGGGSGGTADYEELANLPSINSHQLLGNSTFAQLGLGEYVTGLILNLFYPIGSYYETSDTTFDPNNEWGGTWVLELAGQVHVSAGTGYAINGALTNTSDGGSPYIQAHTHGFTNPTVPNHTHSIAAQSIAIKSQADCSGSGGKDLYYSSGTTTKYLSLAAHNTNSSGTCTTTGGGVGAVSGATTGTSGNMQPYIIVNRWHRTA